MMNIKKWIFPGFLAIAILWILAIWTKGDVIESDLSAKAAKLLKQDHPWVRVEMDGRDLTLQGFSPSPEAAKSAVALAEQTYDVRVVIDGSEPLASASPYRLKISRAGKEVTLTGNAPDHQTREAIEKVAKNTIKRAKIENKLELASGAPEGFGEYAANALDLLSIVNEGEASLIGNKVSFSGKTSSLDEFSELNKKLSELPDGYEIEENGLLPPSVSPYRWSVSKQGSGITLRGYAPTLDAKTKAVENALRIFSVPELSDRQTLASGDPDNSEAVRNLLLNLVSRLDAGQGNIIDSVISITGRVDNSELAQELEKELLNELPQNFSGTTNILVPVEEAPAPPVANPYVWRIVKSEDGVSVFGNATSPENATANIELVRKNLGASTINDNQTLASGAPENFMEAREFLTRQIKFLDQGTGEITDKTVKLTGKVKNKNLSKLIERALNNQMPSGYTGSATLNYPKAEKIVAQAVVVKPPIANPFRWSVSKLPDGVTVLGNVSSSAVGKAAIEYVKSRLGVANVVDKQTVARGASNDIVSLRKLLTDQIKLLEAGQANIIGSVVSVTGKAKNKNIRNLIDRTVTSKLPAGYSGSTNIVFPKSEITLGSTPEYAVGEDDNSSEIEPVSGSQVTAASAAATGDESDQENEPAVIVCQQNIISAVDGRKIQFETARAIIKKESETILDDVVKVAEKCPEVSFRIEGHTDARGRESYNQSLSEARANAIVRYMAKSGVEASRLEARGYGEVRPISDNETSTGRAKNRRIEFKVIK